MHEGIVFQSERVPKLEPQFIATMIKHQARRVGPQCSSMLNRMNLILEEMMQTCHLLLRPDNVRVVSLRGCNQYYDHFCRPSPQSISHFRPSACPCLRLQVLSL